MPPPEGRPKNKDVRPREHLTPDETERLIKAASKVGRHGTRDALMIRMGWAHGLRVSELIKLRRDDLDLDRETLFVRRLKKGTPSIHPLGGAELRELRKILRTTPDSPYVFNSERGGPLSRSAFEKIIARAGRSARFDFPVHPHMLRHSAGYKRANQGKTTRDIQLFLGHKNIQHTVRYTELVEDRFKDWKD
jgi:type 1 fimbriae regulatory protein FimB/type 1 fimbriae regulatory protein FimE